jgi:hypothetical protein
LVAASQPANGSLRSDFFGRVNYFKVELSGGTYQTVTVIRATAPGGTPQLEVRNLGTSLEWLLTRGTPPTQVKLGPKKTFTQLEVPPDLTDFSELKYQDGVNWISCVSFRFGLE